MRRLPHRYRQQAGSYRGAVYMSGMSERIREGQRVHKMSQVGFQAASAAVAVVAPSRGRVEVLRSGQPGHGWPMAAGPRSRTGARACRALARHRTKGARALWLLSRFSKVTRRKGETNSRRYRRNGYVHHRKTRRLTHSHREQAHSHRGSGSFRSISPAVSPIAQRYPPHPTFSQHPTPKPHWHPWPSDPPLC